MALFTPDGKKIIEADSEHLIEGSETVSAIAETSGTYLIEVRPPQKTARSGRYEIKVEELRAATAEDKYRVAGEATFRERSIYKMERWKPKERASRSIMKRWSCIEERLTVMGRLKH